MELSVYAVAARDAERALPHNIMAAKGKMPLAR